MKRYLSFALLMLAVAMACNNDKVVLPYERIKSFTNWSDTIETEAAFKAVVEEALVRANDTAKKATATELVKFIKLSNSIDGYLLFDKAPYSDFEDRFNKIYIMQAVKAFDCEVSIGMGFYCKKNDMMIGGLRFPPNSHVFIREFKLVHR